jgi:hypothetical protein
VLHRLRKARIMIELTTMIGPFACTIATQGLKPKERSRFVNANNVNEIKRL